MAGVSGLISRFRREGDPLQPPTAISDGVTHGPNGTWAWVVLPPRSTDERNTSTLVRMTATASNDLRRLIPPGYEFHCKVQWGRWSGDDYFQEEWEEAQAAYRQGLTEGGERYNDLGAGRIEALAFPKRLVLLGVRMDVEDVSKTAAATAKAKKLIGTSTDQQSAEAALAATMKRIRGFIDRMADSSFAARPATVQELSWALRHDLRRTVDWVPATAMATGGQVARLRSTQVVPAAEHVEITTDTGTRYLRMVIPTETGFPDADLELPGGEWLKDLNVLRGDDDDPADPAPPAEVSIRGRNVPRIETLKILRDAFALTKEQKRSAAEGVAQEVPDAITDSSEALRERIREVQTGAVGMVEDTPCWIVEASSIENLDQRTVRLVDFYGGMGISLWAPPNIQDLLWKETVIGDKRRVTEFTQFRPISTLVGAWFHGGSEIGTRRGSFLASNQGSTPGPFRNRLSDAQMQGKKITSVFLGGSGSGKSTAVMLSVIPEVVVVRAWVALLDIKGDLGGCAKVCEEFGAKVTRISTADQASGTMCPFRYVAAPGEAASMAVDNLSMMLPPSKAELAERYLRKAANQVAGYPSRDDMSTAAVISVLCGSDDPIARDIGEELAELAKDGLARPIAGPPDLPVRPLPTGSGLVYIKFENLRWPGSTTPRAGWKPGNRITMMLVQAVFNYMDYMAAQVKGIPKVLALTELHRITPFDIGRDLVGGIARTGRALDTNLLLDTQACAELLSIEGLADQVSDTYAFGVDTDDEADAQARFLGLEPEQIVRNRQQSREPGECLARDRSKQIAPLFFDTLTSEIKAALRTTPDRRRNPTLDHPRSNSQDEAPIDPADRALIEALETV